MVMAAHAGVAPDAAALAGISDLHAPSAAPAADQALQQGVPFAGGAAAPAARSHVGAQPLARLQVLGPGDIAGMVIGQADRPLLQRHLEVAMTDLPGVEILLAALAAEHERAGMGRFSGEVMHGAIAGPRP